MVSYTRLLLLVLLLVGTPLFLLFVGSMNLGQQIAASTVLIAFFALFIFSGRKPLPPVPKTQVVVEENQEEVEEEQPIATEVEVQTDEQVTRSRGRVAAPLTPPMPPPTSSNDFSNIPAPPPVDFSDIPAPPNVGDLDSVTQADKDELLDVLK